MVTFRPNYGRRENIGVGRGWPEIGGRSLELGIGAGSIFTLRGPGIRAGTFHGRVAGRFYHPPILCLHPVSNPAITGAQRAVYRPLAGAQDASASVALVLSSKRGSGAYREPLQSKQDEFAAVCRVRGPVVRPRRWSFLWGNEAHGRALHEGEVA